MLNTSMKLASISGPFMLIIFGVLIMFGIYLLDKSAPPGCHKIFGKNED